MHRRLLWLLGALWVALAAPVGAGAASEKSGDVRTSVLLIITDDMGRELGAYGDLQATTPRIDRLAAEGLRFDNAYSVAPTCSPSRAAIYTGLPPHANGHWGFPSETRLERSVRTAPQILREAGYFTGNIGKIHVRARDEQFPFEYERLLLGHSSQTVESVARRVERFLARSANRPFFLVINTRAPHAPYPGEQGVAPWPDPHAPGEMVVPANALDTPEHREGLARMYDAYSLADAVVGSVLDALAAADRAESTLVILISDHGPSVPAGKATLYEGGVRIPMSVRWPGVVEAGRSTSRLVSTLDLLPTLTELAGVAADAALPGESLLPQLRGQEGVGQGTRAVFVEQTLLQGGGYFPQRGIRVDDLKYIRNLRPDIEFRNHPMTRWAPPLLRRWDTEPEARRLLERYVRLPREELYDLARDPHELHNLAESPEHAEVLTALRSRLRQWMAETHDPWLALWDYDGSKPDPFEPTETAEGPFRRKWLDSALATLSHPVVESPEKTGGD